MACAESISHVAVHTETLIAAFAVGCHTAPISRRAAEVSPDPTAALPNPAEAVLSSSKVSYIPLKSSVPVPAPFPYKTRRSIILANQCYKSICSSVLLKRLSSAAPLDLSKAATIWRCNLAEPSSGRSGGALASPRRSPTPGRARFGPVSDAEPARS